MGELPSYTSDNGLVTRTRRELKKIPPKISVQNEEMDE
jgi:hypothetical protein